jgi:predicted nuclease of restriction endonuclease-like (RecB) superfamily
MELTNQNYATLLQNLKTEISQARIRTHLSVNKEMITLYWKIGNQILERQQQEGWGTKVIENISKDLQKEFLEMKGLSYQNISSSSSNKLF